MKIKCLIIQTITTCCLCLNVPGPCLNRFIQGTKWNASLCWKLSNGQKKEKKNNNSFQLNLQQRQAGETAPPE